MNNRIYDQTEFTKLLSIISPRGMNAYNNDQGHPDARYEQMKDGRRVVKGRKAGGEEGRKAKIERRKAGERRKAKGETRKA